MADDPFAQRELEIGDLGKAEGPRWQHLHVRAALVFRPNTPIDLLDVFSGRDTQLTRVCDVVLQPGQHAILFGERGVGKTSLATVLEQYIVSSGSDFDDAPAKPVLSPRVTCDSEDSFESVWRKVFARIRLNHASTGVGFHSPTMVGQVTASHLLWEDAVTPDVVLEALEKLGQHYTPILVIDEFDRLDAGPRRAFADLIKSLSDHDVQATVVLVGVAENIDGLLSDHASVARALVQVPVPRMSQKEIERILVKGSSKLGMSISGEAVRRITRMAQGLPHYAHLLGLHATRAALGSESLSIDLGHVHTAVGLAIQDASQSILHAYIEATRSAHKGNMFADVLLACAVATCDDLGYFAAQDVREPMCRITKKNYDIPSFAKHLNDFSSPTRGNVLQVVGESRRFRYRFRDPLMQPYVIMQGETVGRLPKDFFTRD